LIKNLINKEKNIIYSLKNFSEESLIIHHHLGLGDHIICNGLINQLSELLPKIYLPVKTNYLDMIKFLFKEINNINFFEVSDKNSDEDVKKYASDHNLKILRIGFEKVRNNPFNKWFYEQMEMPYSYSFEKFYLPNDDGMSQKLKNHLINYYDVNVDRFALVHNESHDKTYNLQISNDIDKVFVNKETDLYNNLFFYKNLIETAEEIHCINSSFLHLVDRVPTNAKLFYHHIRKSNFELSDNWKKVEYEN